ncbi:RidA family protein [Paraburkholderia sp. BL21I4N1]|uniref:RidA family protein n=1 Tax=Paraburkholderia sp. BL21I4N1 TaxID=1938801 RepID=UPI000CFDF279|nr:RidA family protein [Paraburkholderia sp. BL21I4N1]PQV54808.1 enamine deaminase RidA (YjgF/YER057c/UK114 family) [Paraburkholderia sp. BL21I4N1]
MTIDERIRAVGLTVPDHAPTRAAFKPFNQQGNLLVVSGQLPLRDGKVQWTGAVPEAVSVDDAKAAARLRVLNVLGYVHQATGGNLERVTKVLKLGGYVVTSPGFADAPSIINAASELITQIFGDRGEHARIAIGVASLPLNAPVEVEATFILED